MGWFDDGRINFRRNYKDSTVKCTYYHDNGKVSAIEEYKDDTVLIAAKFFDSTGAFSTSNLYIENNPLINEQEINWYSIFSKFMYFPQDIQGKQLYGKAVFYIRVDRDGNISMGETIVFIHPEVELALKRAIEKFPKCTPAIYHNRVVTYLELLRFNFVED